MAWRYKVKAAVFYQNEVFRFKARYAGAAGHYNDSSKECVKNKGPLPRGTYTIGTPYNSAKTGAFTLPLTPDKNNSMCGRSSFLIHGDSISNPGMASQGCIIASKHVREKIWESNDRELIVE